jgi:hypothetical protein
MRSIHHPQPKAGQDFSPRLNINGDTGILTVIRRLQDGSGNWVDGVKEVEFGQRFIFNLYGLKTGPAKFTEGVVDLSKMRPADSPQISCDDKDYRDTVECPIFNLRFGTLVFRCSAASTRRTFNNAVDEFAYSDAGERGLIPVFELAPSIPWWNKVKKGQSYAGAFVCCGAVAYAETFWGPKIVKSLKEQGPGLELPELPQVPAEMQAVFSQPAASLPRPIQQLEMPQQPVSPPPAQPAARSRSRKPAAPPPGSQTRTIQDELDDEIPFGR